MKKLIPLFATMLLLASCGTAGNTSTVTPESKALESQSVESVAPTTNYVLTFLEDGELYIDMNFDKAPEGFSVKIGETTLTASGKVKMTKDFEFKVNGTFTDAMNIYNVVDTGAGAAAGKANGVDADQIEGMAGRYLTNFSQKQYGYRCYLCFTDKENGWSTTLPGVDETIKKYSPNL